MELTLALGLNDDLYRELLRACRECKCSPRQFAHEAVESVLASRRLESVENGRNGPRMTKGDPREGQLA
jgi:hypothetical protein